MQYADNESQNCAVETHMILSDKSERSDKLERCSSKYFKCEMYMEVAFSIK